MDKIAIVSDIHGNITALNTVLNDIKERKVDKIIGLGDYVVKCANPDMVLDIVKKEFDICILGNCDEIMCSDKAYEKKFWTRMKIGEERANFLKSLPVMYEFYLSGQLVRLFHASPQGLSHIFNPMFSNSNSNNIYKELELKSAEQLFENTEFIGKSANDIVPDIIGFGHLHTPNLYKYNNKTIFNTGSVGIPNEMENTGKDSFDNQFSTLSSYVILEGNLNSRELGPISFTNVRIPYDIQKEIDYLNDSDMPGKEKIIFTLKTASICFKKE